MTALAGLVRRDVDLAPLTTYKFGGPASHYLEAGSEDALLQVAEAIAAQPMATLVVGRGSNVVISDEGYDGLVIHLGPGFASIAVEGAEVVAGAAASLPLVARTAVRQQRLGLEWCVGVPGSVGGAVRMNAGCHGEETVDWLERARVVDLGTGDVGHRGPGEMGLGYRTSNLSDHEVVTEATFRTKPGDRADGEERIRQITRWRRENQPGGTLNAGSVFKNPPDVAAGILIDRCGLKGFRVGSVAVSTKHANFFVADPGAAAQDLYDLVWAIRRRVGEETGTWLEAEVQFAGDFRPSPDSGAGP